MLNGDVKEAIRAATEALAVSPTHSDSLFVRGYARYQLGKGGPNQNSDHELLQSAIEDVEKCVELNPYNTDCLAISIMILERLGKTEDAAKKEVLMKQTKQEMGYRAAKLLHEGMA
jgi:tetratricopeptide (TPR) repeat protein